MFDRERGIHQTCHGGVVDCECTVTPIRSEEYVVEDVAISRFLFTILRNVRRASGATRNFMVVALSSRESSERHISCWTAKP
jgi:hypothetical protein